MKVPASRTVIRPIDTAVDFQYLARVPQAPDPRRILVAIHGISRNAPFMMRCLADAAEALGYTLLAPVFNQRSYPDYQRLGRQGRGARADLALHAMLKDARGWLGLDRAFNLFGFSGGAQFAHRFVYANPCLVRSLVLAAAGWYTAPDPDERFPYGTKRTRRLPDLRFNARGLADTPTLILVGAADSERDEALRRSARVDRAQGRDRIERARWFRRQLAALRPAMPPAFDLLPDTAHDFGEAVSRGGLVARIFEHCERCLDGAPVEELVP
jgi:pimeloyl-ACP methyl ester carboxylesterase